jgi:hypothetical protein
MVSSESQLSQLYQQFPNLSRTGRGQTRDNIITESGKLCSSGIEHSALLNACISFLIFTEETPKIVSTYQSMIGFCVFYPSSSK